MHGWVVQFHVCFADALISLGESGNCKPLINERQDHVLHCTYLKIEWNQDFFGSFDVLLPYRLRHDWGFVAFPKICSM